MQTILNKNHAKVDLYFLRYRIYVKQRISDVAFLVILLSLYLKVAWKSGME